MSVEFSQQKEKSDTRQFLELIRERGISLDIDDVDAATSTSGVKLFNTKFGEKYGCVKYVQDLRSYWTMDEWFDEIKKKDPQAVGDSKLASISIWNSPEVQAACVPEVGSLALAKFLAKHKIFPYRITSRPGDMKDMTIEWYKKYYPWIAPKRIYIQEEGSYDDNFKQNIISLLNIGFHLDDFPEHAEKVAETETRPWVGLVLQPWSEDYVPAQGSRIIKPVGYIGRPPIIRAFLSLRDAVMKEYHTSRTILTTTS